MVRAAREFGSNPVAVAEFAVGTAGLFLRAGNFRPLGRFAEKAEHAFAFEAAEATGLSLHSVQGGLRLVLVALLATAAVRMVAAAMRSAGVAAERSGPLLAVYSLVLGATLVASHHLSALSAFPVLLLGSPLLMLATALVVARDADMRARRLAWHEYPAMALLGASAAMVYDLVYLAPVLAAVFVVVRAAAAGMGRRELLRAAATRRWVVLSAGFLAVFLPVRTAIAVLCSVQHCNPASEVLLSTDAVSLTARRILTGLPPTGWSHTASRVSAYGYQDSLADLLGNWLIVVLLAAAALLSVRAARGLVRSRRAAGDQRSAGDERAVGDERSARDERAVGDERSAGFRFAAALAALGASTALMPAVMVGLSKEMQGLRLPVGEVWRESFVVQVGWSFVLCSAVVALLSLTRGRTGLRVAGCACAVVLWAGLSVTLLNNYRLGHVGRGTPTTALVRQLSTSVVRVDLTSEGNVRRCDLVDAYGELWPDPHGWWRGPQLREEFNHFMLDRYGVLFCDGPGTEEELTNDPPADWDWRPRD